MKTLHEVCRFGLVVLWLAAASAQATLLNTGGSVIFNFNVSAGAPPLPPYPDVQTNLFFSGLEAGDHVTIDFFGDFDGLGALEATVAFDGPVDSLGIGVGGGTLTDGIFSVRIFADQGPFSIDKAEGFGLVLIDGEFQFTSTVQGTISGAPEPTSLALVSIGAIAAAAIRRRAVSKVRAHDINVFAVSRRRIGAA